MRLLLILRGAPGSGKTTWINENHLTSYTLSMDNIRMLFRSPIQTIYGKESICRKKDSLVMNTMLMILEERMKNGELTIIDAVNDKASDINQYQTLALKHRYKTYVVDFTDIPIKVAKTRNQNRSSRKRVPDHIIDQIYKNFEEQKIKAELIKPNSLHKIWTKPVNLNKYRKIHHIGDIHGCMNALNKAIKDNGGIKKNEFYIFLGDFTDRGPASDQVIGYLKCLKDYPNVVFCEGNHEKWIWNWANNIEEYSPEFKENTLPVIQKKFDKKDIRKFYRNLKECFYYTYRGKEVFASHGGIATIPEILEKIPSEQYIRGVGLYLDIEQIAKSFSEKTKPNQMEVFGHRNPKAVEMKLNNKVFCLEGQVEEEGALRWLTIDGDKIIEKKYKEKKEH